MAAATELRNKLYEKQLRLQEMMLEVLDKAVEALTKK